MNKKHLKLICIIFAVICVLSACSSNKFERGTWEGIDYVNRFLGLKLQLKPGWNRISDDAVAEIAGANTEKSICDLCINDTNTGSRIIITVENLAEYEGYEDLNEKQYLDIIKQNLLNNGGQQYLYKTDIQAMLADEKYEVMAASIEESNIMQVFCARRIGNYMCLVNGTYNKAYESYFYSIFDSFEKP